MANSVDLHGLRLRPLPAEMFDVVGCVNCRQRSARWEMAAGPEMAWNYTCSFCLLYEVSILAEQRAVLDSLIEQIEMARKEEWQRDAEGRLTSETAADCVAFGVVMAQRYLDSRRPIGRPTR